jgi:hypothetical protein
MCFRKCKITGSGSSGGFTNAGFDIMYIDLQRRWEHVNHDRAVGECWGWGGEGGEAGVGGYGGGGGGVGCCGGGWGVWVLIIDREMMVGF